MTPDWQLPPGIDRGLWDYVSSDRVAHEYDTALAGTSLLEMDLRFAEKHFRTQGRLIDLGCGTGRCVIHFARRGFVCTGVDLSQAMLEIVRKKAVAEGLSIEAVQANLVELDSISSGTFDYAACLFSTLGMIRGRENRQRFLANVRRILKPGGTFVLHAHNAQYRGGFDLGRQGEESGDRTMPQHRGGAELTIHHYTRAELLVELATAGFRVTELVPISTHADGSLKASWFLPALRAYGFLIAAG